MIRALALTFCLAAIATPATAQVTADPGARAFLQCRACHGLKAGDGEKLGPNLHGFFGKKAGTNRPAYAYSAPMKAAKIVWDEKTLDAFLLRPTSSVPGTTMAFAGMPKPENRAALIAYLKRETQ
jgi:cytochrome c